MNYLLVLIDDYVAITRPALHLAKFTVRNLIPYQITSSILVCFIAKCIPFFLATGSLDCEPSLLFAMFVLTITTVLLIPCVILKIIIFYKSYKIINGTDQQEVAIELDNLAIDDDNGVRVHATEEAIAKRERAAMRALMYSVLPLLILYIPEIIAYISSFACIKIYSNEKEECTGNFLKVKPFMTEYTALHGIIQPICFLVLSDEFWEAWNNR